MRSLRSETCCSIPSEIAEEFHMKNMSANVMIQLVLLQTNA